VTTWTRTGRTGLAPSGVLSTSVVDKAKRLMHLELRGCSREAVGSQRSLTTLRVLVVTQTRWRRPHVRPAPGTRSRPTLGRTIRVIEDRS
jgi:hypothetical protein